MGLQNRFIPKALLFSSILFALLVNGFAQEKTDLDSRSLTTGLSLMTCQEGNDNPSCNFLNSSGASYNRVSIANEQFSKHEEYQYGNGLSIDKDLISMNENDYSIDLFAHPNTTSTFHPLCEWRIKLSEDFEVQIDITRSTANYEEFYAYTDAEGVWSPIHSKEFANCHSTNYSIKLKKAGYIKFIAKKLNDASDYHVKVSQAKFDMFVLIVIVSSISALTIGIAGTCFIGTIYYTIKRMRLANSRRYVYIAPGHKRKYYIRKCLKNMMGEQFSQMNVKYEQTNCVVCLNDFKSDSKVGITNECLHVFHLDGLEQWFNNISTKYNLKGPLGSTVISDKSQKIDFEMIILSNSSEVANDEHNPNLEDSKSSLRREMHDF